MAPLDSARRQVPFGGHQLAEYTLSAALVAVGVHLNGRPELVLIVGGCAMAVLALITKGPLSAARLIPKRLHLYLDLVLAAGFAVSPVFYLHNLQVISIILCEAVAVLLVRMSFTTEIVPRPPPERSGPPSRAGRLGALMSQRAVGRPTSPASAAPRSSTDTAAVVAATAGRVVGTAVAKARSSGAPSAAARGLGRATGHARRIGRAARAARSAPGGSPPGPPGSATPSD